MDRHMVRMFQRLDRDGDLGITAEEVARPTANLVTRMDRNGDGVVCDGDGSDEDHAQSTNDHKERRTKSGAWLPIERQIVPEH